MDEKKLGNSMPEEISADELLEKLRRNLEKIELSASEGVSEKKSSAYAPEEKTVKSSDVSAAPIEKSLPEDIAAELAAAIKAAEAPKKAEVPKKVEPVKGEAQVKVTPPAKAEMSEKKEAPKKSEPTEKQVKAERNTAEDMTATTVFTAPEEIRENAEKPKTSRYKFTKGERRNSQDQKKAEPKAGTDKKDNGVSAEFQKLVDQYLNETHEPLPAQMTAEIENSDIPAIDIDTTDTDLDKTDIALMNIFGMQDELAETIGIDKVEAISKKLDEEGEKYVSGESVFGNLKNDKNAFEFSMQSQTKDIMKVYRRRSRGLLWRMIACLVLVVGTFFYESAASGLFGMSLPGFIAPENYPIVYTMIGMQILFFAVALVYRQMLKGFVDILRLTPTPYSASAVLAVFSFIYHIICCFAGAGTEIVLFNLPMVFGVLLGIIYEFLNLKREMNSFKVAGSKKPKYTINKIDGNKAKLENESFREFLDEDASLFKVGKTAFVNNFFKRTRAYPRNMIYLGIFIPAVLVLSLIFFIVAIFVVGDAYKALTLGFGLLFTAMPLSMFITYSYPIFRASEEAFESESAIIGSASLEEYSSASAISFEDKDVFPSYGVKVRGIKIYGDAVIDRVIYNAASLFHLVGGPLADVFDVAVDLGHSDDVDLVEAAQDGLEAVIDGRHIYAGKASYLIRNDFEPVVDENDQRDEESGKVSIMYIVIDGEVAAKMYIEYAMDPDFEFVLKKLYKAGMCVGIKSFDPNINDVMLGTRIKLSKYPVRVLKCGGLEDIAETAESADSGIVSKSSAKSLLWTFTLCDKVLHVIKTSLVVKIFSVAVSLFIMAFIMIMDFEFISAYAALYQLFWILPMALIAKLLI